MLKKLRLAYLNRLVYLIYIFLAIQAHADYIPNPQMIEKANSAKVLVAITMHFNASRLPYLEKVFSSLSTFPDTDIIVLTNTFNSQKINAIRMLYKGIMPYSNNKGKLTVRSCGNLPHPYELTWCHKEIIMNEFVNNNDKYSHFIYLEDDIGINFSNFCYFVEFRKILRPLGLLPSFLRVEHSDILNAFVNTDNQASMNITQQPLASFKNIVLVNTSNPYTACFILDRELAAEYVLSRSFDKNKSAFVPWECRERAAMGLCFENIPANFKSRYVVPVFLDTCKCPKFAWVYHFPNNYANDPTNPHGKIRMNSLFMDR